MDTKNDARKSNIESLRIISMLGIVMFHSMYHSRYEIDVYDSIHKIYIQFTQSFGEIGVNIFMMIAGYFMADKTYEFNLNNILRRCVKNWVPCLFYSISITLCFAIINGLEFIGGG